MSHFRSHVCWTLKSSDNNSFQKPCLLDAQVFGQPSELQAPHCLDHRHCADGITRAAMPWLIMMRRFSAWFSAMYQVLTADLQRMIIFNEFAA